jgi:formate-dependent nitrite reductase cytochrome c552 subunit
MDQKILILIVMLMLFPVLTAFGDRDNPHVLSKQSDQASCTRCHISTPELKEDALLTTKNHTFDPSQFSQDGVAMCADCHDPDQGHKVGLKIDFPVPADLPLNQDNDITCLTCHYTHGSLTSERPQASFSFMDRLLDADRLRKSFLLRRNNQDGELCLTCHNVNQG